MNLPDKCIHTQNIFMYQNSIILFPVLYYFGKCYLFVRKMFYCYVNKEGVKQRISFEPTECVKQAINFLKVTNNNEILCLKNCFRMVINDYFNHK